MSEPKSLPLLRRLKELLEEMGQIIESMEQKRQEEDGREVLYKMPPMRKHKGWIVDIDDEKKADE